MGAAAPIFSDRDGALPKDTFVPAAPLRSPTLTKQVLAVIEPVKLISPSAAMAWAAIQQTATDSADLMSFVGFIPISCLTFALFLKAGKAYKR